MRNPFLKFHAESRYGRFVDLLIFTESAREAGMVSVAEPVTFRTIDAHEQVGDPTLSLSNTQAQQLMDALWSAGLRPTEGSGSAGSLAATQAHLKDMREIALGALKVQKAIE